MGSVVRFVRRLRDDRRRVVAVACVVLFYAAITTATARHVFDNGDQSVAESVAGAGGSSPTAAVDGTTPAGADAPAGDAVSGAAAAGSFGGDGTGTGAGAAGGRTAAGGSAAGSGASAPTPRGSIKIGFGYPKNLGAAYAAFGANNLTGDDWQQWIQPIVTWVNAHGGVAGRTVVPVYHGTDPSTGTFQAQAEAACTAFTDDDHVFAVIGTVVAENEFDCLAKKNTPFVAQSATLFDQSLFARFPGYVYQPFMITAERQGVWIDTLFRQGFFASGAKVGLLRLDDEVHARFAAQVVRPHLGAQGVTVSDEFAFRAPGSAASAGDLFSQAGNAVLRFRSEGISEVVLSPTGGAIPFVFMQQAESQKYRPRYALNSLEVPAFVTQNVPLAQLHGAVGIGWLPASDLFYKEVAHGANPAEDLCYTITKRNGDEVKRYCDGLFFLRAALDKAGGDVSVAGLKRGVEALGASYNSPWTMSTRFGPGRYDGAGSARPLAFVDQCGCFRYTGGPINVP